MIITNNNKTTTKTSKTTATIFLGPDSIELNLVKTLNAVMTFCCLFFIGNNARNASKGQIGFNGSNGCTVLAATYIKRNAKSQILIFWKMLM